MPIQVERSVDDPIATFAVEGALDAETVLELKSQIAQLISEMGTFYAVFDLRSSQVAISDVVALLESPDPRVKYVFVNQAIAETPQFSVPMFGNVEAASEYIRREIAANAPG